MLVQIGKSIDQANADGPTSISAVTTTEALLSILESAWLAGRFK